MRSDIPPVANSKCSDRVAWGPIPPKPKAARKSHLRSRKDKNMSLVINTNYSATVAANNLAYSHSMLQNSLNELSSGSKLYSSAADAGGTATAMTDNSNAINDGALIQANADALSTLQTQDGALQVAGAIITRMSQINTLSYGVAGGTGTSASGQYAAEFTALQTELATVATAAGISLSAVSSGSPAGSAITAAIATVASARATNGASQSVDGFQNTLLTNDQTNQQSAFSTVSDVDVAQASTQLAKWNVLVQAGTAMLAQANQSNQLALKLLQ